MHIGKTQEVVVIEPLSLPAPLPRREIEPEPIEVPEPVAVPEKVPV